jgi:RNA-directed DNA polymerase
MINQEALRDCFKQLKKRAASGVDGVSHQEYDSKLESNLENLVRRLINKGYHARLVRRVYIPKSPGKLRPLGLPVLEDKLVQQAAAQILSAIYEADFYSFNYGYRPGRSALEAVQDLTDTLYWGEYNFVVEVDVQKYFENIRHDLLLEMLSQRVDDKALLGLINKWLKAGILETDGQVIDPQTGTPQGGVISPVLANVYLHYVVDQWFEKEVRSKNRGRSRLFRYADDFVACFEHRHEAEAFEKALSERLAQYGLKVAPDKTKTIRFDRNGGPYNGRFDFLGFEFRWEPDRQGKPIVKRRTARKKLQGSVQRFSDWIKKKRHTKLSKLMATLRKKFSGYWNYYGIIGNFQSLQQFYQAAERLLYKWLNRRSQKRSLSWSALRRILRRFQIPRPRLHRPSQHRSHLSCSASGHSEVSTPVDLLGLNRVRARA